jgi:hypothetical protein
MDEFSYLSVLLSIVLGFALQQVLLGYRSLLLNRTRVRLYAPPLIWSAMIVLIVAQNWWASFGLSHYHHWGFAAFGMILLEVVLLYMMAGVVLPDVRPDEPLDLRDHYYRERRWFFGLFLATLAASLARDLLLNGHLPDAGNLGFHLIFICSAVAAMLMPRQRFHEWLAPIMGLLLLAYVGLLFARLS